MSDIEIHPWAGGDLDLLRRANTPELMDAVGGVESDARVIFRHERYLRLPVDGGGQQYRVVIPGHPEGIGTVGYWVQDPSNPARLECGWSIEEAFRGRGIGPIAAELMIAQMRAAGRRGELHAYPKVDNAASNAVCRKLGFKLVSRIDHVTPDGRAMPLNDWVYDLGSMSAA